MDTPTDDQITVIKYNTELFKRFFSETEERILKSKFFSEAKQRLTESLNLMRAVNSFRAFRTPEALFASYPNLKEQKQYVELVWADLSGKSDQELSDLAMEMIHELDF